jgi:mitochondrial fission protein ELM1
MTTATSSPSIWVISDGTKGMEVQSLGLAESLSENVRLIHVKPDKLLRAFPRLARMGVCPMPSPLKTAIAEHGMPDIVITTGRRHAPLSMLMRRYGGGKIKTVHIQDPRMPAAWFDWLVVPSHDPLRGENVLVSLGSLNRMVTLMRDIPPLPAAVTEMDGKKIVVLIGGSNRRYQVHDQDYAHFGQTLADVAAMTSSSLILIPSRRSLDTVMQAMAPELSDTKHWWWDGTTPNPYPWILTAADAIIVTADSVNMTSEAACMGKPVYVAELKPESGRVALFHKILQEGNYTESLNQLSFYHFFLHNDKRLDETTRIAAILSEKLSLH